MSTDPPWLDEAARAVLALTGEFAWEDYDEITQEECRAQVRAVLAFAARQPREITEAEVEAALERIRIHPNPFSADGARAALEAAEKARRESAA